MNFGVKLVYRGFIPGRALRQPSSRLNMILARSLKDYATLFSKQVASLTTSSIFSSIANASLLSHVTPSILPRGTGHREGP